MATLSATHPTLLDVTRRIAPGGQIDQIAEVLNQTNEVLDDMVWQEGNLATGHRSSIRTGLPPPTWRKMYGGVQPSKSTTAQITDSCGMLEAYAEVDQALADLGGNAEAFRRSEDAAFIEGMSEEFVQTLFYGNETIEPEAFTGLSPRFNTKSGATNGSNVITSAVPPDASDNASVWLVVWSPQTVFGIYPKGSMAGLRMEDKGRVTIENIDGAGGRMEAYRTHYKWDCGLVVRDWRYIVRIQVDQEDLVKNAATGPDLIDLMAQATEVIPNLNAGRAVFYMNRTVRSFLRRQIFNKLAPATLTMEQITTGSGINRYVPMFDGIPVKRVDQLLNTEAGIS